MLLDQDSRERDLVGLEVQNLGNIRFIKPVQIGFEPVNTKEQECPTVQQHVNVCLNKATKYPPFL
jgi:hypothetical protein